jgi:hypothetical protein
VRVAQLSSGKTFDSWREADSSIPAPTQQALHPSGFDSIMPRTLATAAVDRLLHHAHIVPTEGSSLRLTQAPTARASSR